MPVERIYTMKGLDLRSNELLKAPNSATIADNVDIDDNGYLRKRFGYVTDTAEAGFIQLIEYQGRQAFPDPTYDFNLLGVKVDGLYGYSEFTSAWIKIPYSGGKYNDGVDQDTWIDWSVPLSYSEYDGNLYMADPSGTVQIMKYDGNSLYRAGVPKPNLLNIAAGTGTAGTFYVRVFLEFADFQYVPVSGDYVQFDMTSSGFSFDIESLADTAFKNYNPVPDRGIRSVKVYISNNPTFGYRLSYTTTYPANPVPTPPYSALSDLTVTVPFTGSDLALAGSTALMTDIYDYTVAKRIPPLAKYLEIFGNQMVVGNYVENNDSSYDPQDSAEIDSIRWSDLSTGGTVEAMPALNTEKVGKSDIKVTGIFGASDNLIVMKDSNVFYLSGTLFNGNFRFRDSLSEGIGCIAHKTIQKIEGGAWFLSPRGLYMAKGGHKPIEFSDAIQPLFNRTDLTLTDATAVLDSKYERIYCYIPSTLGDHLVVVYDYYHKEWLTYSGINASGGIVMVGDDLYHSDGTNVYKRTVSTYNDNGVAISAEYATSWFNQQMPSMKKKYVRGLIFSIHELDFDLKIETQKNWLETAIHTINKRVDSLNTGSMDFQLSSTQAKALRFIFSNATLNEDIEINGYEYSWEQDQIEFKGND